MKLTGFTDEAALSITDQISATKELGWDYLSARGVDGVNLHDLEPEAFAAVRRAIEESGLRVAEFGSLIGSWSKNISSDFSITLGEVERCIDRMGQLDTNIVRVMSYAQEPWGDDQQEEERFRRLREVTQRFNDHGIVVAHENCMNYGGFSADHTLKLLDNVPGMKLVFDTGNPVFQRDRSKPEPHPWQDAWAFYETVREHIVHVHIKDCRNPVGEESEPEYVFPGEGQAYVREILDDLAARDYQGFIAIEPHVATVFHVADKASVDWNECRDSYVRYGKQLQSMMPA